jgi:tetratricopeptide (TPR) repeat protein
MNWNLNQFLVGLAMGSTTLLLSVCQLVADEHGQKVLNNFAREMQSEQLDATTLSGVKSILAEGQDAPADAITESLLLLSPAFADAIENADAEDVEAAIETLTPLTKAANKFLAADASFYLARTLMNCQRYEAAIPLLDSLTGELGKHSAHQGTAQYYTGVAQSGLLQNKKAIESLMAFLKFNPDAAERLRVGAWRLVQELQAIKPGKLDDIHQRMDFSRRRLAIVETDDTTQAQQGKIVSMLNKLIKEEEKKELSKNKGGS